jgi:hypothetical protein
LNYVQLPSGKIFDDGAPTSMVQVELVQVELSMIVGE